MKYKNARYTATGNITCEVDHPTLGWIPFTASENDSEKFGKDLFKIIKKKGDIFPYIEKEITLEEATNAARQKRNSLLGEIDVVVSNPLRWESMSKSTKDAYKKYRQELLDVPQQSGFPYEIIWPKLEK